MRISLLYLSLLAAGAAAPLAQAQPVSFQGLWTDLRVAYALPSGAFSNTTRDEDMEATFNGLVPVQLELGWRFDNGLQPGVYGQLGWAQTKLHCPDCSGADQRFGIQLGWHPAPRFASMLPWLALGIGREHTRFTLDPVDVDYSGWDAMLSAGADYRVSACVQAGLVLALDAGVFTHLEVSAPGSSGAEDLRYQALHFWLSLGLHGAFGFNCQARVSSAKG